MDNELNGAQLTHLNDAEGGIDLIKLTNGRVAVRWAGCLYGPEDQLSKILDASSPLFTRASAALTDPATVWRPTDFHTHDELGPIDVADPLHDSVDRRYRMRITESHFTRLSSTDEQEEAIRALEKTLRACGKSLVGGTTIGKSPQTVVLDLTHQGSEIYVDSDGQTAINGEDVNPADAEAVKRVVSGPSLGAGYVIPTDGPALQSEAQHIVRQLLGEDEYDGGDADDVSEPRTAPVPTPRASSYNEVGYVAPIGRVNLRNGSNPMFGQIFYGWPDGEGANLLLSRPKVVGGTPRLDGLEYYAVHTSGTGSEYRPGQTIVLKNDQTHKRLGQWEVVKVFPHSKGGLADMMGIAGTAVPFATFK